MAEGEQVQDQVDLIECVLCVSTLHPPLTFVTFPCCRNLHSAHPSCVADWFLVCDEKETWRSCPMCRHHDPPFTREDNRWIIEDMFPHLRWPWHRKANLENVIRQCELHASEIAEHPPLASMLRGFFWSVAGEEYAWRDGDMSLPHEVPKVGW